MRTAVLEFAEYPGQEVVVRLSPIAVDDYFSVLEQIEAMSTPDEVRAAYKRFADLALVSWTFPEPADGEGMLRRDYSLSRAILREWAKGVREVPVPLPLPSSDGDTSPVRKASKRRRS